MVATAAASCSSFCALPCGLQANLGVAGEVLGLGDLRAVQEIERLPSNSTIT